ncbi:Neurobeachin Lysosomal-trafficking regulator 2 [Collichthys lucidus]|uniref:Neurobeachin Lysosomal-trafficking regulator 2 n=1 Tax=Collichthys lucidus TaxID=240159 RepID=A0A4V6AR32_COLLU|nr:Neurobeachin Lysosomal-trafficking regulator 2 [Collichthys lucidus]
MSSEKPVSAPLGSASSLADTDRDSHPPPPGSSVQQPQQQQQQQVAAGAGSGATTGERMVSAAGSMVLPAGVINPAVPIRNIQMKFAVLVGLIQVGEVSNRDIVETVLNLADNSPSCSSTSSFTLEGLRGVMLPAKTGLAGQRHAFKSRWRGGGGGVEGGWGRRRERVEEEEEEEDEVVGCCSGYVLRNHQLMQWKRKGLWIGPHHVSESSSEHSTEISA